MANTITPLLRQAWSQAEEAARSTPNKSETDLGGEDEDEVDDDLQAAAKLWKQKHLTLTIEKRRGEGLVLQIWKTRRDIAKHFRALQIQKKC